MENPRVQKVVKYQDRFQVMIWAAIIDQTIIGPFEFEVNINGETYRNVFMENLNDHLEEVDPDLRNRLIFMEDDAPAHYARITRDWLNQHYPNRWVGRLGPINWPAQSPDLRIMDFSVWGALKEEVYEVRIDNLNQFRERINMAFENLRIKMRGIDIVPAILRIYTRVFL
jgi:hypothetical protein